MGSAITRAVQTLGRFVGIDLGGDNYMYIARDGSAAFGAPGDDPQQMYQVGGNTSAWDVPNWNNSPTEPRQGQ